MTGENNDLKIIPCSVVETRSWYATNDLIPPAPNFLHVVGKVKVDNTRVRVLLSPTMTQGLNPRVLELSLYFVEEPGTGSKVVTWYEARYIQEIKEVKFERVEIYCGNDLILTIEVKDSL